MALLDGLSNLKGAWSFSRPLLTSYGAGTLYTTSSGEVTSLKDQTGLSARNFDRTGTGPAVTTVGKMNRAAGRFDGSAASLTSIALSNFLGASAGYMAVSCVPRTLNTNDATATLNDAVLADSNAKMGIYFRNEEIANFSSTAFFGDVECGAAAALIDQVCVLEWYVSGGVLLSGRLNKSVVYSTLGDCPSDMTGLLQLGFGSGVYTQIDVAEIVAFSAVPTPSLPSAQDAIVDGMLTWLNGAPPSHFLSMMF